MPLATILALLQAASVLLPELQPALPTIEKAVSGQAVTPADIENLDGVIQALNAKAAAGAA